MASISDSTVWRWPNEDAIRPWQHRCRIFPRDPHFAEKASRILDLYERVRDVQALEDTDPSADLVENRISAGLRLVF